MTDDEKLMQQALDALLEMNYDQSYAKEVHALRERLAQPEQEPVAWADMDVRGEDKGLSWTPGHFHTTPLYTTPPQRKPLTDEEITKVWCSSAIHGGMAFARVIEAAHGIKERP